MDDMQFAEYTADIREILEKTDQEGLENLVRNAVAYANSNNNSKINWIAQELFAEALWLEWDNHYGIIHKEKLPDLLRRYNLKLKREKTLDDIQLAFGRGLKDTFGNTVKQIE